MKSTETCLPLAADSVTSTDAKGVSPVLPSGTVRVATDDTVGGASLSVIVPLPSSSAIVAPTGLERRTKNVSFASSSVSPTMVIATLLFWCPPANFSVPLRAR